MSMESAVAFYEKMDGDPALQESMKGKTAEELERFVRDELGYDFTKEEMQKVIFERNPEMTDEELEAVVGGISDAEGIVVAAFAGVVGFGAGLSVSAVVAAAA